MPTATSNHISLSLRHAFTAEPLPAIPALPTNTAAELWHAVAGRLEMPPANVRLLFGGLVLQGQQTLEALGILDGTVLDVACQIGRTLLVGYGAGVAKLWDCERTECRLTLRGHMSRVTSVACSPDGHSAATGSQDGTVKIWSLGDGACTRSFDVCDSLDVTSVAFSPDGAHVAAGCADGLAKLLPLRGSEGALVLAGHQGAVSSVAVSPDGHCIATGSSDRCVRLWDAKSGWCVLTADTQSAPVTSVTFSPDGNYVAVGMKDTAVEVMSRWNGQWIYELDGLDGHSHFVTSAAFSPNGRFLITGSDDSHAKVWSMSRRDCRLTLQGHRGRVMSVAVAPDGLRVATCSDDGTVKVWGAEDGKCLLKLEGLGDVATSVALACPCPA